MTEQSLTASTVARDLVRIMLPLLILASGAAGAAFFYFQKDATAHVVEEEKPPPVETAPAEAHDRGLEIEVDGVVVPYREIELSAEVDGRVDYKNEVCRAGKYVEQGTLLLKIDPRDHQLEIRRLVEGFDSPGDMVDRSPGDAANRLRDGEASPRSLIGLAERELRLRKKELARLEGLSGGRVVSDAEIEQGELSVIMAENTLQTLRSQLEKARLDLERTQITSPIDGVVVNDAVEQGDFVRRGTALVSIEDTSKVEVKCSLRVDELYWLWSQTGLGPGGTAADTPRTEYQIPDAPVNVVYRVAKREYVWEGRLSRYEGVGLDETTRTVPCRVVVERPREARVVGADGGPGRLTGPPALVRGMFVSVKIHAEPQARLIRIPEKAVRPGSTVRPGNCVWIVRDVAEQRLLGILDVTVVRVADETAIVLAGDLEPGDRVVVTPLAGAKEGMVVREQAVE